MLRAVTDNSYIVYGCRSFTIVLLYVAGIWTKMTNILLVL